MNRRLVLMGAACTAAFATRAFAQDDILKKLINRPGDWTVFGSAQTNKHIKDAKVQGGNAIEVKVAGNGGNPWDAVAINAITGKIAKGDRVVAAVWMRSQTTDGAPVNLTLQMQVSTPPFTAFAQKPIIVGPDWQMQMLEYVATEDHAPNTSSLSINLNTGKHTIYLGVAYILNMSMA
jgi:hypothetical protein